MKEQDEKSGKHMLEQNDTRPERLMEFACVDELLQIPVPI
jgi:hypothetical protein